jgi:hypothetical protein
MSKKRGAYQARTHFELMNFKLINLSTYELFP